MEHKSPGWNEQRKAFFDCLRNHLSQLKAVIQLESAEVQQLKVSSSGENKRRAKINRIVISKKS